jgi:hypothetical protein
MPADEHDPYLEERFPKLRPGLYRVKSPKKSKLGIRGKDIEHDSLELLEGDEQDEYGQVVKLMKKRRYESEDIDV